MLVLILFRLSARASGRVKSNMGARSPENSEDFSSWENQGPRGSQTTSHNGQLSGGCVCLLGFLCGGKGAFVFTWNRDWASQGKPQWQRGTGNHVTPDAACSK